MSDEHNCDGSVRRGSRFAYVSKKDRWLMFSIWHDIAMFIDACPYCGEKLSTLKLEGKQAVKYEDLWNV